MKNAAAFLEDSLRNYRAGKANPQIFNNILVDYYGSKCPVPQVASVSAPDAKTILIQPWEKKLISAIEKAIFDANVGMTPQNNGETIRCVVPALTGERRRELIKKAKSEGESAKTVICIARYSLRAMKMRLPYHIPAWYNALFIPFLPLFQPLFKKVLKA